MPDASPHVLREWENFYVIAGSAAAALTGLMFVVITLIAGGRAATSREGVSTFSTPTVVHFCAALLVSELLSVPWRSLTHAGLVIGIAGLCGAAYCLRIAHRTRKQTSYEPEVDDWLWYVALPLLGYVVILGGAISLPFAAERAVFALGAGVMLLIFIGIHNAWDVVTYIAIEVVQQSDTPAAPAAPAPAAAADTTDGSAVGEA